MKNFFILLCVATFLISCGGNKKAVVSRTKRSTPKREVAVVKEPIKNVEKPKAVEKEPLPELSYKAKIQRYIYEYSSIAKNEMKLYGIPASITLAQGILESGAGYGDLTRRANNHFGIKCHDWEGDRVFHDDDLSQECFRKYDLVSESFRDHSLFLANRKRYAALFKLRKNDYKGWAKGLKAAGYATDKKYPDKLISIIQRYELYKYDREVLGRNKVKRVETVIVPDTNSNDHTVAKGDTLYSISRKYKITVEELRAFNNLKDNTIKIGQVLKIVPEDESDEF
ncbi:glucosaminidase domain-containing protein [Aquimarina sp. 2201CG5-10]|uniref:glucosaminidase domain-containing protein n=1 Tax=Aquimarina callyspongiae TaxID=3098150 RepID=UPI002AB3A5D0|nr:glucosaminidase domain-containing protein [Aquimarina sp. 2201CG5-10]MDY8136430.1 glucosaminidase domain-containing protein [Aquimarina sp. 2201CG5-10]